VFGVDNWVSQEQIKSKKGDLTRLHGISKKNKMVTKTIAKIIKPRKEVRIGDLWILGDHRLVCGSASDKESVEKAVGENKIRQILTDPPYGVAYVENRPKDTIMGNISVDKIIQNDRLQTDQEYSDFTKSWLELLKERMQTYNTIYIFNGDLMICALRHGIQQAGFYFSQIVVWVKGGGASARKDHLPQHELIAYGWYGRHKMERAMSKSVIIYPKPHRSSLHPTMKPVGLLRKLIENSTKIGEIVYDPFGGSGSTLIACEQFKRKCAMIELDPNYCSTIIQRWELLTGGEARKVD
jgi:DNA modification methylase